VRLVTDFDALLDALKKIENSEDAEASRAARAVYELAVLRMNPGWSASPRPLCMNVRPDLVDAVVEAEEFVRVVGVDWEDVFGEKAAASRRPWKSLLRRAAVMHLTSKGFSKAEVGWALDMSVMSVTGYKAKRDTIYVVGDTDVLCQRAAGSAGDTGNGPG
jgi:hypothetical protein